MSKAIPTVRQCSTLCCGVPHSHDVLHVAVSLGPARKLRVLRSLHTRTPAELGPENIRKFSNAVPRKSPALSASSLGPVDLTDPHLREVFEAIHEQSGGVDWMVCMYAKVGPASLHSATPSAAHAANTPAQNGGSGNQLLCIDHGTDSLYALQHHTPGEKTGMFSKVSPTAPDIVYIYLRLDAVPRSVQWSGARVGQPAWGIPNQLGISTGPDKPNRGLKTSYSAPVFVLLTWLADTPSSQIEEKDSDEGMDTDISMNTPTRQALMSRALLHAHGSSVKSFFAHHVYIKASTLEDLTFPRLRAKVGAE